MREWLREHLLHLGWALFGQESDCEYSRFNWLARWIGEGQWTEDLEPANLRTAIKFHVGHALVTASNYLWRDPGDQKFEKDISTAVTDVKRYEPKPR